MNPSIQRSNTLLRPSQRPNGPSRRPASIAELAQRARDDLWDERRELKFYLRSAERHRKTGKEYAQGGDLEAAFVEFAKAATLVLERLPTHKDYLTVLTTEQRYNLGLVCIELPTPCSMSSINLSLLAVPSAEFWASS
jgi:hypothetical protein